MLKKIIPHISIITCVMMLTLFVLNQFNEAMGFLRGDEFETLLLIFITASFITSVMMVSENRKHINKRSKL